MEKVEGYINVEGGKIWYCIYGADSPGIPLLTVHGGPGAPHNYLLPLVELSNQRPVIFYDQLGCGNSERPEDLRLWNTQRFTDELAELRKQLNLDTVFLLGQSWGTMLIAEYMLRHKPVGVKKLILSGPYLSTPKWVDDQKILVSQLDKKVRDMILRCEEKSDYNHPDYLEAMNVFYSHYLCTINPWPEQLNDAMAGMGMDVYYHMWGPSEFTMNGTLKHVDLCNKLNEIDCPVLLSCGEFDEARPETTNFYKSCFRNAEMYVFKGASHSHILEKPLEYISVLNSFLEK